MVLCGYTARIMLECWTAFLEASEVSVVGSVTMDTIRVMKIIYGRLLDKNKNRLNNIVKNVGVQN